MANLSVTYRSNDSHSAEQKAEIDHLNETAWELESIEAVQANCKRLECRAELTDDRGFARGSVESNGNYRMQ